MNVRTHVSTSFTNSKSIEILGNCPMVSDCLCLQSSINRDLVPGQLFGSFPGVIVLSTLAYFLLQVFANAKTVGGTISITNIGMTMNQPNIRG